MIYASDTVISSFGDLLSPGPIETGPLAVPLAVFCAVGVINAINMADGLAGRGHGRAPQIQPASGLAFHGRRREPSPRLFPGLPFRGDHAKGTWPCFAGHTTSDTLSLPLTDCVIVMLKRISKKRGPFFADALTSTTYSSSSGWKRRLPSL
jgi:UDP-N-acetylmuramyl pentapeptide phosphotransferase/UDP-N-acetylglucosamine-1-phosphate transferase